MKIHSIIEKFKCHSKFSNNLLEPNTWGEGGGLHRTLQLRFMSSKGNHITAVVI